MQPYQPNYFSYTTSIGRPIENIFKNSIVTVYTIQEVCKLAGKATNKEYENTYTFHAPYDSHVYRTYQSQQEFEDAITKMGVILKLVDKKVYPYVKDPEYIPYSNYQEKKKSLDDANQENDRLEQESKLLEEQIKELEQTISLLTVENEMLEAETQELEAQANSENLNWSEINSSFRAEGTLVKQQEELQEKIALLENTLKMKDQEAQEQIQILEKELKTKEDQIDTIKNLFFESVQRTK